VADHFGFDDLVEIIKVLAHTIVYFKEYFNEAIKFFIVCNCEMRISNQKRKKGITTDLDIFRHVRCQQTNNNSNTTYADL